MLELKIVDSIYSHFYFILLSIFLFFDLGLEISITLYVTVIIMITQSHVTQKNVEDSRIIILYYIIMTYNIYTF